MAVATGTGHRRMEPPARAPWQRLLQPEATSGGQDGERPMPSGRGAGDRLTIARLPGGHALCIPAVSPISCTPSQRPHSLCCDLGLGLPGRPDSGAGREGVTGRAPVDEAGLAHVEIADHHHLGESEPERGMAWSRRRGHEGTLTHTAPPSPRSPLVTGTGHP